MIDIDEKTLDAFSVNYGDIVFQRSSETPEDIGRSNVYLDRKAATFGGFVIRGKMIGEYNPLFLKYLLDSSSARKIIIRMGQGAQHYNIGQEGLKTVILAFPNINEQKKISKIISLIEKRIEKQRHLIECLKSYKRGVIFNVFVNEDNPYNILRETTTLKNLLNEYRIRETAGLRVCSVAVNKGVIDQIEHLGRSFAAADTSHYGRVKFGDVVYTKSPTGDFPYGIVKQNKLNECVAVSPLYGVYTPNSYSIGNLLHNYFEQYQYANNYIAPLAQKGAKNTINISNGRFLEGKIVFPCDTNSQERLSLLFDAIDKKIKIENNYLMTLIKLRQGLLQKMFI